MLDPKELSAKWAQLKSKMTPEELARVEMEIEKAHQDAKRLLETGVFAPKGSSIPKLTMVKTVLGEGEPLDVGRAAALAISVDGEGQIWGTNKYEQFDPEWASCLFYYQEYKDKKGTFGGDAQVITIPNQVKLSVVGDWGTGFWRGNDTPAKKVADLMVASNPDIAIHLGDTYYCGTQAEMNQNLALTMPRGQLGTFAIPGNHEMYCGDIFYNEILPVLCPKQNGASYFALENENWFIVCLDSAYYSPDFLYTSGSIIDTNNPNNPGPQVSWLMKILAKVGDRKVIVMTHHQPIDLGAGPMTELASQVKAIFSLFDIKPAIWYFGHEHNAAVYTEYSAMALPGRCIGHGAIPYGVASDIGNGAAVEWAETKSANDPEYPERILNGYLEMVLDGPSITEKLIAETGELRWSETH